MALLGGALAASTPFHKSGTRVMANASPEPFSNWALSIGEDIFVVGLGFLALKYPAAAAVVVILVPGDHRGALGVDGQGGQTPLRPQRPLPG